MSCHRTDIFRGRYSESFEHPSPIPADVAQHYRFALPNQNYVFEPGHWIMVQIQSTLFPLCDRNPQIMPLTSSCRSRRTTKRRWSP
jgi:predicted acyl esterase